MLLFTKMLLLYIISCILLTLGVLTKNEEMGILTGGIKMLCFVSRAFNCSAMHTPSDNY